MSGCLGRGSIRREYCRIVLHGFPFLCRSRRGASAADSTPSPAVPPEPIHVLVGRRVRGMDEVRGVKGRDGVPGGGGGRVGGRADCSASPVTRDRQEG